MLIRKDGSVMPVRITSSGGDAEGRTPCIFVDITEQRVMERELEYHSAELERYVKGLTILNQIIGSAATLNLDQVLINACRVTRDQFKFDLGGVCLLDPQKKRTVLVCDDTPSPLLEEKIREIDISAPPYDQVFTAGQPLCVGEGLDWAEQGIRSLVVIPLESDGVVRGAIFLATSREPRSLTPDEQALLESIGTEVGRVIETRKMQQELRASYEKTNLYLDIMTHDINNAATAALGYTECLSEVLEGREAAMATKLQASIRQSIGIIRNVSTIRTITETERGTLPIDLDMVIRDQIAHYPGTRILYSGHSTIVAADDLVGEVLTNLIGNSRKFAGPDGTIMIKVEPDDRGYQVSVEDDGPGIPDSEKPLVFDRFLKGAGEKSGRGLGLYIARMLVEQYGGRIRADDRVSGSPEQGAAIRFILPAEGI
jgi:signal transduction histidine kinase